MRSTGLILLCASAAAARNIDRWHAQVPLRNEPIVANDKPTALEGDSVERFLVETAPGKTSWITEDEKWQLRREGMNFMDITEYSELHNTFAAREVIQVSFPANVTQKDALKPLLKDLSKDNMKANLVKFSSFYTRYYKSKTGAESSAWLQGKVTDLIKESGADKKAGATVESFPHSWGQNSIIARIPGKSNRTVVVGAHQDSINLFLPSLLAAPGADDDGSGTVTILEALRALLGDKDVVAGKADNTIEFHWYSAEEGGLLGSQAIFQEYARERRDVRAMLQQDMTGFSKRTIDAGKPEALGVITDFVDVALTEFIKTIIDEYCDIPYVLTKCGYACSDHASASKAGYPSAFAIESEFDLSNNKIHTEGDVVANLDFNHMLQHGKMTLALVYELAHAKLDKA